MCLNKRRGVPSNPVEGDVPDYIASDNSCRFKGTTKGSWMGGFQISGHMSTESSASASI